MEKKNVFLVGANGRMGKITSELISNSVDFDVPYVYDQVVSKSNSGCNIYNSSVQAVPKGTDVIIDFSKPNATMTVLPWAVEAKVPMVIAPTGYTPEQNEAIAEASKIIPIFKSSNMSYGVNAMIEIVKLAAKLFYSYDSEILDFHHSGKVDSPSGTANMLAEAIKEVQDGMETIYGRTGKRQSNEIGIAAQRGGGIPGEHVITFAGPNDFVRLQHFALKPEMFAEGALDAARFILKQTEPRLYTMKDLLRL